MAQAIQHFIEQYRALISVTRAVPGPVYSRFVRRPPRLVRSYPTLSATTDRAKLDLPQSRFSAAGVARLAAAVCEQVPDRVSFVAV